MTGLPQLGRGDLLERLIGFDEEVGLLFPGSRFELLIVGGGALALLGVLARPTSDIDVLSAPADLHEIMARYDINGRAVAYEHNFPFNRDDRRQLIDIPTTAVTCYVASLEDLVAAKLCSPRDQDEADLRSVAVLDAIDWQRLAVVAGEMPQNCLNKRRLGEFQSNYERYLEECGPCEH
jgi:hypothetical protein